jgi:hypothetical protein
MDPRIVECAMETFAEMGPARTTDPVARLAARSPHATMEELRGAMARARQLVGAACDIVGSLGTGSAADEDGYRRLRAAANDLGEGAVQKLYAYAHFVMK